MKNPFESLKGRVAVITGAVGGMGVAICEKFAAYGMKIVLVDYDESKADSTIKMIEDNGGEAIFVKCDITKEEDVKNAVDQAVAKYGRINTIVNLAGIGGILKPVHEVDVATYDRMMAINLRGVFLMMKYGIEGMLKTKSEYCNIVNMASTSGVEASTGANVYSATKFGVVALTKNGAVDYAKHGIRVNAVCPYMVRTGFLKGMPTEMFDEIAKTCPNGRAIEPYEVADSVLFLASDMASYINGAVLTLDAGETAGKISDIPWAEAY